MILLDSDQILATIGRSLADHVLPALDDDYARIQVQAALTALEEVRHRLAHGDPYADVNAFLREHLGMYAEGIRATSPDAAARVERVCTELDGDDPRRRYQRAAEMLGELLASDDPALAGVRTVLEQQAGLTASADAVWICSAAIESLQ